jgi:ribonuclease Z
MASSFSRFVFLGTSSAVPRPGYRNVSSMLLQSTCGSVSLIDCGEATQHQLMKSTIRMSHIDNILVTHLHGDHCYGLFGLVHTLNMSGRMAPLQLWGPVGINELVTTVLRLTGGWDSSFDLKINELEPEETHHFELRNSSDHVVASVTACPMVHRIPAFGYVFKEPDQPRVLDGQKAKQLGASGQQLGQLKAGSDVVLPDGRAIRSADVTAPGRPSRTVAVMQDTRDCSSADPYMTNCDLLVHEATFESVRHDQAIQYGHSTSVMAAEAAIRVNAKTLVLTHFSSRYSDNDDVNILKSEAEKIMSKSRIILAEDFLSIGGHDFDEISSALRNLD